MTDKTLDLSRFDSLTKAQEDGIDVQINGPDGKPLGFTIKVAGPDSARQKAAQQAMVDERLQRQVATPPTAEEIDTSSRKLLASSTMGWDEFELDGAPYQFSVENAAALYERFPFIREQVDRAAGNRARFLAPSKTA